MSLLGGSEYIFWPKNFVERVTEISKIHELVILLELRLQSWQGKHVGFEYGYKLGELEFGCSIQYVIDVVFLLGKKCQALPIITVAEDNK